MQFLRVGSRGIYHRVNVKIMHESVPGRGFAAQVGQHTGYYHGVHAYVPLDRIEVGSLEGAVPGFPDDGFAGQWLQFRSYLAHGV